MNKKLRKLLAGLLAGLMLVSTLASCTGGGDDTDTTSGDDTTTGATTPAVTTVTVPADTFAGYKLVYSFKGASLADAVLLLQEALQEKTGLELALGNDFVLEGETAPTNEILVGTVMREEWETSYASMRNQDYIIRYDQTTKRLLIAGGTNQATRDAVNYFINNCINEDGSFELPVEEGYVQTADYAVDTLTVAGISMNEFYVKAQSADARAAGRAFSAAYLRATGYALSEDSNAAHQIILGMGTAPTAEGAMSVTVKDGNIYIDAQNPTDLELAPSCS